MNKIISILKSSITDDIGILYLGLILAIILIVFFISLLIISLKRKNKRIKKLIQLAENETDIATNTKNELDQLRSNTKIQSAVSEILKNITGKERKLDEFIQDTLNRLLSLSWQKISTKGAIYLLNNDGNLEMYAQKNLGEINSNCKVFKPSECLCGRAIEEKNIQFIKKISSELKNYIEPLADYGLYNIPIELNEEIIGIINLYTEPEHKASEFEIEFLQTVSNTVASVIQRKKAHEEIIKTKNVLADQTQKLEETNKAIRLYTVRLEQQANEKESLNQMILAQKKKVELKSTETETYAKEIELIVKQQDALNQQLFVQKLEVEQRNIEVQQYSEKIEKQSKDQEALNQKLFAQKLEVEQRNIEVQQYAKELEKKANEQEALNQKLFAQKLEVEQRNIEVQQYLEKIEKQAKNQEALNQKLFAQKLEVEQRNIEVQQYAKELEKKAIEQEALNQKLFAQKLEVEQRNSEIQLYMQQIEKQKIEQDKLNQKLFAQSLEVDQRRMEVEQYSKQLEILKQNAEDAYKHISDSINYSKYIQDTLLPEENFINKVVPGDHFIYYKPKEIIGGDFYYVNQINDWVILGVADCTGHGVPGALITMLGITFLDDIIGRNLTNFTGDVLNLLREKIKYTFKSYGENIQNKNGLDIALCAVNKTTNELQFSGAFSPMFIYRNSELIEFKATRNPIGYYPVEKEFETSYFQLQKNDIIYLFSDGYQDQVGGELNRKFSKKQLIGLFDEIHHYPMKKQQLYIEKIMQRWMGKTIQVDDMTIMGIHWDN